MGTVKIGAAASGMINRRDFGINYRQVLENGVMGVADEVYIQIDVELIQEAPKTSSTR
jgi:polyisoprenoid-binding protein YceI